MSIFMLGETKVNTNVDNNNTDADNNNSSVDNTKKDVLCVLLIGLFVAIFAGAWYLGSKTASDNDFNFKLEFQINSIEVKVYNNVSDKNQHLMADLDFDLTLKNKIEGLMYFNPMEMSLEYHHDEFLSSTMLDEPNLLLEEQRQLQFGMQIKDDDARLQNRTVDSISRDLSEKNVFQFSLKGKGRLVRWTRGHFANCGVDLLCDDIKVRVYSTNGSMIVSPLLCKCNSDCHFV